MLGTRRGKRDEGGQVSGSPILTWSNHAAAVGHALALGGISWVFSEGFFWAHWRASNTFADAILTWSAYCIVSYIVFSAVRWFDVHSFPRVFLAGAVFGWLVEGGVAATIYVGFPFQVVWTSLAWHAPVTICSGWFLLPRALRGRSVWDAVCLCAVTGLGVGFWASGYVHDPEVGRPPSPGAFGLYVSALAIVLAVAYLMRERLAERASGPPDRRAFAVTVGALSLWFISLVVVAVPWAPVVLAGLLAMPLLALLRGRHSEPVARSLQPSREKMRPGRVVALMALPPPAIATYLVLEPVSGQFPLYAVYAVSVLGGLGAFVWALWREW